MKLKRYPWRWWWPQLLLAFVILMVVSFIYYHWSNNYNSQNIASGYSFLNREAGFEISESVLAYESSFPYWQALSVGLLNTLKIALLGNFLALILGVVMGLCLVSRWIFLQRSINKVAQFIRNVPLLLQLLFWYSLFTDIFPGVREAWHMGDWIYLCNRGIYFAHSQESVLLQILFAGVMTALLTGLFFHHRSLQNFARSGNYNVWWHYCLISAIFSTIIILGLNSWSLHWQWPELEGFNFSHGYHLTPEFSSLLLGLVLYTSCFMADIVRSAIQSVDKGQREAASSLGMNSAQIMFLVVLPQSLRVMIPPLVGQILNLTKNSTLAVAIAYPDFVSVANTTLNQTGQAVELMLLIMGVYLCFSLITSLLMNYYNRRFALRGGV